jgi:hypothetical protein
MKCVRQVKSRFENTKKACAVAKPSIPPNELVDHAHSFKPTLSKKKSIEESPRLPLPTHSSLQNTLRPKSMPPLRSLNTLLSHGFTHIHHPSSSSAPCPIYLSAYTILHLAIKTVNCTYIFGKPYLLEWLRDTSTCPMCKGVLYYRAAKSLGFLQGDRARQRNAYVWDRQDYAGWLVGTVESRWLVLSNVGGRGWV